MRDRGEAHASPRRLAVLTHAALADRCRQEYREPLSVWACYVRRARALVARGIVNRDRSVPRGRARALLFPIDWPELFGLVMIAAMACGTPVVTRPCGAVPEIVPHDCTGLVASDVDELVDARETREPARPPRVPPTSRGTV